MADIHKKRPLGVTFIAALLVLMGGAGMLVITIEIIDSIGIYGFHSLFVSTPASLLGFMIYGIIPVAFYSTGMGLFLRRPWARFSVLFAVPVVVVLFFLASAIKEARGLSGLWNAGFLQLFNAEFSVFAFNFFRCLLVVFPLIVYFRHPRVAALFRNF